MKRGTHTKDRKGDNEGVNRVDEKRKKKKSQETVHA